MTQDELHKAVEGGLGVGGRMDNAHEVLWDECQALRAERDALKDELTEIRAIVAAVLTYPMDHGIRNALESAISISTPVKPKEGT